MNNKSCQLMDNNRRIFVQKSSAALALQQAAKLGGIWITPVVSTVFLPAHAITTGPEEAIEDIEPPCPTETSSDVIVTAGNIQEYRAGDQAWGPPIGPVPDGNVAFNMMPSVSGTLPSDVIFWEYSLDDGVSFFDVSVLGVLNGETTVDQESSGTGVGTVAIPDTENQSGTIFRVTITREGCADDILRGVTYQIVGTTIFDGGAVPQFAVSWDISYTSLDANLSPMGAAVNLPTFSA
jgi:hypothetical protein